MLSLLYLVLILQFRTPNLIQFLLERHRGKSNIGGELPRRFYSSNRSENVAKPKSSWQSKRNFFFVQPIDKVIADKSGLFSGEASG